MPLLVFLLGKYPNKAKEGFQWVAKLINNHTGLKVTTLNGTPVDIDSLKQEWEKSKSARGTESGETGLIISESSLKWKNKLQENESRLMPHRYFMNETTKSLEEGSKIAEDSNAMQNELKTINKQLKDAYTEYKRNTQMHPNKYMQKVAELKKRREELIKQIRQGQGMTEGTIKDAESALAKHGQYKIDYEKKYGPMNGADLHQHEVIRKQLLDKKSRAQSDYNKKMKVSENMGPYDNDKGIIHSRASLVAKLEKLPIGNDDFEWNRVQAIYHLKQGNMLRAKYYMHLLKRGEQGVTEGSNQTPQKGDEVYYRGTRLVGWFKGYNSYGNKVIVEPDVEEMGDEYIGKDAYFDINAVTFKPISKLTNIENQGVAEGASELLKAEMPLVRHIERELVDKGWQKSDDGYDKVFKSAMAMYRKFGNVDAIKKQDVVEGLSWKSLDNGLSLDNKMAIFEEYHTKGNLFESNDEDKKSYFVSLFNMSSTLEKNKRYIVVPLSLINNKILPLDNPSYLEYLGKANGQLVFRSNQSEIRYPSKTMRDMSVFNTFTFSSTDTYDKFRTALTLKFNTNLSDVILSKNGVAEGSSNTEPKLGAIKAQLINTKEPTVQVQVFKHNTLRGDNYWITKEVRKFKSIDSANAYVDRINKQNIAEGETTADIDSKIAFHKQGQAAAQYKGAMNKMHANKIRELLAKKKELHQNVAEGQGWNIDSEDHDVFTPEEIAKIKKSHFPEKTRENLLAAKKEAKKLAWFNSQRGGSDSESNLGSALGGSDNTYEGISISNKSDLKEHNVVEGLVRPENVKQFEPLRIDHMMTLKGAEDNLKQANAALEFAKITKDKEAFYRAKMSVERLTAMVDKLKNKKSVAEPPVNDSVNEEIGYDEVSAKSAAYILRKLDQGTSLEDILDDFPELNRYAETLADSNDKEQEIKAYLTDLVQQNDEDNGDEDMNDDIMENSKMDDLTRITQLAGNQTIVEGKVKELSMDLKELSDEEFLKKYKKTKQEIKKEMKVDSTTELKEMMILMTASDADVNT